MTAQERKAAMDALSARRWKMAGLLTAATVFTYFGFILLVAFAKPLLGTLIVPGLSLGIALGASVIVIAWLLTGIYMKWAAKNFDDKLRELVR